jgi:glycosyltransferase involved in cell wall biosynthesis
MLRDKVPIRGRHPESGGASGLEDVPDAPRESATYVPCTSTGVHMNIPRPIFMPVAGSNPYQAQLAKSLSALGVEVEQARPGSLPLAVLRRRPNILHLHWLGRMFIARSLFGTARRLLRSVIQLAVMKLMDVRIVWTAHNLRDHLGRHVAVDDFGRALVVKMADAIIAHGESARRALVRRFGKRCAHKIAVIPHGHYLGAYPNVQARGDARKELGLPDRELVALFFGGIAAYKGVLELLEAFRHIPGDAGMTLVLAGRLSGDIEKEVRKLADGLSGVKLMPERVPDDRVQTFMNSADVVVLPFRDIFTSGSLILAMSFGRAVIAPRMGAVPDVLDEKGGFLYDPDEQGALLNSLRRAVEDRESLEAMGRHNLEVARRLDWDRIAQKTLEVYRGCVRR